MSRRYDEPIHLFDGHTYDKGGRVMHMVRHILGDETFFRAIRHYATIHAHKTVETRDFARAIEDVSGRNLEGFFDRWVARSGHPELTCAWQWDDDRHEGQLRIQQTQVISDELPPFQFDTTVRFEVGRKIEETIITVREPSQVFTFRLASRPEQVVLDPGDVILKTVKMDKPRSLWRRQLAAAALGLDRSLAAAALGESPDPESVTALGHALGADPFWGVQAAAARALGRTRRQDALDLLLAARTSKHHRVRRAVAAALGEYRGDVRVAAALTEWVRQGDRSLFVEAEAALALGKSRAPDAAELLREAASRPSFQDTIRARALDGLGALGGEQALSFLREAWRPGGPFPARKALVAALVEAARGTLHVRGTREYLEDRMTDPDFRVRGEIAAGLARLGDGEAVATIERALAAELDGRARRRMLDAIRDLREGSHAGDIVVRLQDEVARLRTESGTLRERLDRLEGRGPLGPGPRGPSTGGDAPRVVQKRKRPPATRRGRARQQRPARRR